MSLNPRQERFAHEYLVDLNMTAAYKRAGYKAKGHAAEVLASNLLKNLEVQAIVQAGRQEVAKKTLVTVEFVIDGFKEVAQRCLQRVPVMRKEGKDWVQVTQLDANGVEQGVWEFDSSGANRALEMLGKHAGAFKEDEGEDLPMPTVVNVNIVNGRRPADIGAGLEKAVNDAIAGAKRPGGLLA